MAYWRAQTKNPASPRSAMAARTPAAASRLTRPCAMLSSPCSSQSFAPDASSSMAGPGPGGDDRRAALLFPRPGAVGLRGPRRLPGLARCPGRSLPREGVRFRRHDEVVSVEPPYLVGPPGDRHPSPLGEESRMVALLLGEGADPVRESQRLDEGWDTKDAFEPGDAVALYQMPTGNLAQEPGALRLRDVGRVAPAGHA